MINNKNNNNNNNNNNFQGDPEKEYWGTYVSRSYSLSHYTSTG